jgi:hypothetical protein
MLDRTDATAISFVDSHAAIAFNVAPSGTIPAST